MEPFYFGKSPCRLFGIYHEPKGARIRKVGIILCYPMGHEYIYSHFYFCQLATLLSLVGFHVLRFDFYGCGDSEGDSDQGTISQWLADISTAVEELKGSFEIDRICLAGLRLGGSLSMMTGVERDDIDGMVLWDPIFIGNSYIKELKILHQKWVNGAFARSRFQQKDRRQCEILGFPLTDFMIKDLRKINLLLIHQKPASHMLMIETHKETENKWFREYLKIIGVRLCYRFIEIPQVRLKKGDVFEKGFVFFKILKFVVSWISQLFP